MLLFTPPFDHAPLDPGYIKGYLPGVRENGGQYTHAAIWSVMAFAALGDGDKADELFSILNPINHASTRAGVHRYKVEPYVVAADVYAEPPHVGRGGWTWYTGLGGLDVPGRASSGSSGSGCAARCSHIDPCIPRAWRGFEIAFRYHAAALRDRGRESARRQPRGPSIEVDGVALPPGRANSRSPTTARRTGSASSWEPTSARIRALCFVRPRQPAQRTASTPRGLPSGPPRGWTPLHALVSPPRS